MVRGIGALLERSLRIDARDRWTHGMRLVTLVCGYGALIAASNGSRFWGAPGLRFFETWMGLNACLIAVAGLGYFVSVITEEKEEGTLGLMQMAGISGLGIILGKFGSRLIQAGLIILLQLPFALLGITLGGVTIQQVQAAMLTLMTLLFMTANLALLLSVVSRNSRQAGFRMTLLMIVYCVGSSVLWGILRSLRLSPTGILIAGSGMSPLPASLLPLGQWLAWLWRSTIFYRMDDCFRSTGTPTLMSPLEITNLTIGGLAFGFSWLLFGWATRQPDTEPLTRGWLGFSIGKRRYFTPGRCWDSSLLWKEFYFLLGGWPRLALRLGLYLLFIAGTWVCWHVLGVFGTPNWGNGRDHAVSASVVFLNMFLAAEGAWLASRLFSEEVRGQTWSTLASLPVSFGELCYMKVAAAFLGLLPVCCCLVFLVFFTFTGQADLWQILDDPPFYGFIGFFVAMAHLACLFSLYVRWGAVPLAFAVIWLPFMGCIALMDRFIDEDTIGGGMVMISVVTCVLCHILIGHRLKELAAA
ncbi:hypothetical protein GC163_11330 [bacterium]|nr:hypothetical protein [bacterium]